MKNVKTITLALSAMLFFSLFAGADRAYAGHYQQGGSFGLNLPNLGLYIGNHGVTLTGPGLYINTRPYRNGYRPPYYSPYYPPNRYNSYPYVNPYPYSRPYSYPYNRYTPQRYNHHYYDQIRRQQERYRHNIYNHHHDCR